MIQKRVVAWGYGKRTEEGYASKKHLKKASRIREPIGGVSYESRSMGKKGMLLRDN